MTTGPVKQCEVCKWFISPLDRTDPDARAEEPTQVCRAFPLADGGIPDDIWQNRVDHRQPVDGDHGIRWASDGAPFPAASFARAQ